MQLWLQSNNDIALINKAKCDIEDVFTIGDTGATCHIRKSLDGMYNLKDSDKTIMVGDNNSMKVEKIGSWKGEIEQKDGTKFIQEFHNVNYVPSSACNICSLTTAINNGWKIWNDGHQINITKNDKTIKFDQTYISSPISVLFHFIFEIFKNIFKFFTKIFRNK